MSVFQNELSIYRDHQRYSLDVEVAFNKTLRYSRVSIIEAAKKYFQDGPTLRDEILLHQALSTFSSQPIAYRDIFITSCNNYDKVTSILNLIEDCWLRFRSVDGAMDLYLLSDEQGDRLNKAGFEHLSNISIELENGQVIGASPFEKNAGHFGGWYMLQDFVPRIQRGEIANNQIEIFQLCPYNMAGVGKAEAPLKIIIDKSYKKILKNSKFVTIYQVDGKGEKIESSAYPVDVSYLDTKMPGRRVSLHESILLSLGFGPGDPIFIEPSNIPRRVWQSSSLMGNREIIAIAQYAHDIDAGYAVGRMNDDAIDLLGVTPGQRVEIRGRAIGRSFFGAPKVKSIKIRCLPYRGDQSRIVPDAHTKFDVNEAQLPVIHLDLLRREELQIQSGQSVIIKPALTSILADEVSLVTNAVAVGVAASIFTMNLPLVLLTLTFLVGIIGLSLHRKFG